jgi:hypothetical protein
VFVFLANFCSLATEKGKKEKANLIGAKAFFLFLFWGREIYGPKSPPYEGIFFWELDRKRN